MFHNRWLTLQAGSFSFYLFLFHNGLELRSHITVRRGNLDRGLDISHCCIEITELLLSETTEVQRLGSFAVDFDSLSALLYGIFENIRVVCALRHVLEDDDLQLINLRGHVFDIFCLKKGVAVLALSKLEVLLSELDITEIFKVSRDSNQFRIII